MVNLKAKPYYLSDEDIAWVEKTIAGMTDEEKVGQLFFDNQGQATDEQLREIIGKYHLGGFRYNGIPCRRVQEVIRVLQEASPIPLFIACNTESGGNGTGTDGTYIADGIKIGATGNAQYAYDMARMGNEEGALMGNNMAFAPVCDIHYNWENTEVVKRAFGNDVQRVLDMSVAYMKGVHSLPGYASVAKHFPGNGQDFRDAHMSSNINEFTKDEWMATYGKVYKALIDEGLDAVMGGHIMLPKYMREIKPGITDDEMLPATLCPELIDGLLRDELGFNGMVLTDASHMVGLTCRMKRKDLMPAAIAAGVDMFLFFNDMAEDFQAMKDGVLDGRITQERLSDALHRILALKAHMGLHKKARTEIMPPREQVHKIVGCAEHKAAQKEISDRAITLVKYKDADVLPMIPERYKRTMIVYVKGLEAPGLGALFNQNAVSPADKLRDRLIEKGFDAFVYESPIQKLMQQIQRGEKADLNLYFAGKSAIKDFVGAQDLIITMVDIAGGFQPVARPAFGMTKGGGEIPWYVHELPVIVVGTQQPFVLADIPQARTYINTYDSLDSTLDALVEKLMTGPEAFHGQDPVDAFCGVWDTHL